MWLEGGGEWVTCGVVMSMFDVDTHRWGYHRVALRWSWRASEAWTIRCCQARQRLLIRNTHLAHIHYFKHPALHTTKKKSLNLFFRSQSLQQEMSSHVVVIDTTFRRTTIKVTPGKFLTDVLEEACSKLGLKASNYGLKYAPPHLYLVLDKILIVSKKQQ